MKIFVRINNKRVIEKNNFTFFKGYEVVNEAEKNYYTIINENGNKVEVLKKHCKIVVPVKIEILECEKKFFGYNVKLLFNNKILITSKSKEIYFMFKNSNGEEVTYCDEIILKMNMNQDEIFNYLKKVYEEMN